MQPRGTWRRLRAPMLLTVVTVLLFGSAHVMSRPAPRAAGGASREQQLDVAAPARVAVPRQRREPDRSPVRPLTLVGLGDSVPAGSACGCTPFVELYARRLAQQSGRQVHAVNAGVAGETTRGLLTTLTSSTPVAAAVRAADVVTITIGANDLDPNPVTSGSCATDCYQSDLAGVATGVRAVLARIAGLRAGRPTEVQVTGYWNIWKDGAVGRAFGQRYVDVSDRLTRLTNGVLAAAAASTGATYVDLYRPFKGPSGDSDDTALLAADGDHPAARGHVLIAAVLAASPATAALSAIETG